MNRIHVLPSQSDTFVFGSVLLEEGFAQRVAVGLMYNEIGITELVPDTVNITFRRDSGIWRVVKVSATGKPVYQAGHVGLGISMWSWGSPPWTDALLEDLPDFLVEVVTGWAKERMGEPWRFAGHGSPCTTPGAP